MEKSDSLNINQMDVFFVDLCSFISVSETLYSRKKTRSNMLSTQSESGYR